MPLNASLVVRRICSPLLDAHAQCIPAPLPPPPTQHFQASQLSYVADVVHPLPAADYIAARRMGGAHVQDDKRVLEDSGWLALLLVLRQRLLLPLLLFITSVTISFAPQDNT